MTAPPRLTKEREAVMRMTAESDAHFDGHEACGRSQLTLFAEIDALRLQLTESERQQFVPGEWVCATCGFTVTKSFLHAADMSVSVDTRAVQDICPNDGTSLRQQTWKERAEEAQRIAVQQMDLRAEAERALAITSLAIPLEEELSDRIDNALRDLAICREGVHITIGNLLIAVQRRMADDWVVIGREREQRLRSEEALATRTAERDAAREVLRQIAPQAVEFTP